MPKEASFSIMFWMRAGETWERMFFSSSSGSCEVYAFPGRPVGQEVIAQRSVGLGNGARVARV